LRGWYKSHDPARFCALIENYLAVRKQQFQKVREISAFADAFRALHEKSALFAMVDDLLEYRAEHLSRIVAGNQPRILRSVTP
jgi:hypothetical protein